MRIASLLFLAATLAACGKPVAVPSVPNVDAVVARVAAGLRPAFVVKGEPAKVFSLAERLAHYKVPGVSIALVDSGRIVWARGYGLKETGTTDSVTPATLFQAASISKPVAATAMLHLVEEGKLALDMPVNEYLKSWKLPDNKLTAKEKVTLRRIVSHYAGLTVHGFPGYAAGDSIPTVPQILDGKKPANTSAVRAETVPGTVWNYSGGGITIEQLAMMDVTGEPFPALVKRLVLDPIGMTNSGYDQPLPAGKKGQEAAGYRADGKMVEGRWHTYPEMAAAGLWTTPTDLLKWAMEITAARAGKSTKVLSQKMATEMLTVQKAPSGLGPMLHGSGHGFYFEHGGANEGFRCEVLYFPEIGRGAAVMTNSDAGSGVAQEILYALASEYRWPDYAPREIEPVALDSAAVSQLVGEYPIPSAVSGSTTPTSLVIRSEAGALTVEATGLVQKAAVVALAGGKLMAPETGFEFSMIKAKDGRIAGLDIGSAKLTKKGK